MQYKKHYINLILILSISGLFGISCVSSPKAETPAWVERYPHDPDYYIGIGSADTGDRGADLDEAFAKAYAAMAAEISLEIESQIEINKSVTTESGATEDFAQFIRQSVEANLKAVEKVDSYFHPDTGQWAFVRLNKAEWAAIQAREIAALKERVENLFTSETAPTLGEKLSLLSRARTILLESPYANITEGTIDHQNGILLDIIQKEEVRLCSSVIVNFTENQYILSKGDQLPLKMSASCDSREKRIPMILGINGSQILIETDAQGHFEETLPLPALPAGEYTITLRPDSGRLGIHNAEDLVSLLPVREGSLILLLPAIALQVESNSESIDPPRTRITTLLKQEGFQYDLVEDPSQTGYQLYAEFDFFNFPQLSDKLALTKVKLIMTLLKDGREIYAWESDEIKDGGQTWEQAHERALGKLLSTLARTPDFIYELEAALE